jgi:RNA polymerase sigma factor (sigma-70 family)
VSLPPFQSFLDENRDAVWRFLVSQVGPIEADDVFQETFMSALRAYPRLRGESNLRGWVMTIAHNKAMDAHRSRGRRATPLDQLPDKAARVLMDGEPEVWKHVRELPEKQRAAVLLRFAGDMAYREIGVAIGCSEAAARQNVRAGLKALREVWVA